MDRLVIFLWASGSTSFINSWLAWKCVIIFVVEVQVSNCRELFSTVYFLCLVFTTALEVGEQSGMVTDEGL